MTDSETVNKTQLDIERAEDRGIVHRDYLAHCLRWSFALRHIKYQDSVLDIGCANAMLAQVLYVNKYKPWIYVGIDIRPSILEKAKERQFNFDTMFHDIDIRHERIPYGDNLFNVVTCFEVIEHFMPEYLPVVFKEIVRVMKEDGVFLLSTPNFNGQAAANHVHEYTYQELKKKIEKHFIIEGMFGTFASKPDIYPLLNEHQQIVYDSLSDYYDNNVMSVLFAPLFPKYSRNIIWILRRPFEKKIETGGDTYNDRE